MLDASGKLKKADWIGIPAKALVSIPMRFHGIDAGRRESAAQLELEGAGLGAESQQPHLFETRVHDEEARDQRAWTCVQAAPLPKDVIDAGLDSQYAPVGLFSKTEARPGGSVEGGGQPGAGAAGRGGPSAALSGADESSSPTRMLPRRYAAFSRRRIFRVWRQKLNPSNCGSMTERPRGSQGGAGSVLRVRWTVRSQLAKPQIAAPA